MQTENYFYKTNAKMQSTKPNEDDKFINQFISKDFSESENTGSEKESKKDGADILTKDNAAMINDFGQDQNLYRSGILPISIIGEVEGHMELSSDRKTTKYEHIIPLILEAEENSKIKGVLLILNTLGGDVEAGLAISELISGITKPTVSLVLGGGHSIGVPLSICCDYTFIAPTATMTIHPVRMNGLVIGVMQSFDYFKRMQERIIGFAVEHSNITHDEFNSLMLNTKELLNDVGSILVGEDAVNVGLINEVGTIRNALDKLKELMEEQTKKDS